MSLIPEAAMVCGFGEVASGAAGLAWDLGQPAAMQLYEGEARAGSFALEEGGDAATVAITAEDEVLEAVLAPQIEPALLEPAEGGHKPLTVVPCLAEVHPVSGGQTVDGTGHITRWTADPLEGAGTFRHLAIEAADGTLLVAVASGAPGLEGHGDERVSAWQLDANGLSSRFDEALISTQYDGEGRPTRIGLELWPGQDSPPTRVACSLLGGTDAGGLWAGLFSCHTAGTEGLGSCLLRRA